MSGGTAAPALGARGRALLRALGRAAPGDARTGLSIEPGLATARVRRQPRGVHVLRARFAGLSREAWARVVARLAAEPSLLGALLDGELPEAVVEAAGGLPAIVPARRDVAVTCTCLGRAGRCPCAGAARWALAERVDSAPATLLTLRGRGPERLVAAVRREVARRDGGGDAAVVSAAVPAVPPPPPAGPAARWTPPDLPDGLGLLVADAAARARDLRSGGGDGGLGLSEEADLARRAARLERDPSLLLMARLAGLPLGTLAEMGATWRQGGAALVDVIYGRWSPAAVALAPGRRLLAAHGAVTVRRNRVCLDRRPLELRLGRDGLWYLVDVSGDRPSLLYPPAGDPALLVAARLGFGRRAVERPRAAEAAAEQLRLL